MKETCDKKKMMVHPQKCLMPWGCGGTVRKDSYIAEVLILVILQKICFVLEPSKWQNLYENICETMLQFKLIERIHDIGEFPISLNFLKIANHLKEFIGSLEPYKLEATTHTTLFVHSLLQILWKLAEPERDNLDNIESELETLLNQAFLNNDSSALEGLQMICLEYQRKLLQMFFIVRTGKVTTKTLCELFSSQYLQEFHEKKEIGSGGAGEVFAAQHRLDKIVYAIKKIKLNWTSANDVIQHLAEVKILASLNHPNVVDYKTVRLELLLAPHQQAISDTSTDESGSSKEAALVHSESTNTSDSDFIEFKDEVKNDQVLECVESVLTPGSDEFNESESNSESVDHLVENIPANDFKVGSLHPQFNLELVLYIQMFFLPMTLKDYLEQQKGTSLHIDIVKDIFMQLVNGLNHVHNKNYIHHDIKPSNILVKMVGTRRIHVCLADFGLACINKHGHTGEGFGTPLYAAPEQLEGRCTPKVRLFT